MKHLISYFILILMISFSFPAKTVFLKGTTNCALGDFIIEKSSELVVLDGYKLDTYTISYENSAKTVSVAVRTEEDCCRYIVFTDELSVQYICYKEYFGVLTHDKGLNNQGFVTDANMLDKSSYFYQKLITRDKDEKSLKGCLGLIAAYYPMLLTDMEKVFACNIS